MNFFRNIFLLFLAMLLFNSCVGAIKPVSNYVSSGKNGESRISINGAIVSSIHDFNGDDMRILASSISYWKKIDKDTTYEFYIAGVRRIEEIYHNGLFYLDTFTSAYLSLPIIGGNLGFTTGLKSKNFDIYASLKGDALIYFPILADDGEKPVYYRQIKPALGLILMFGDFSLSLESSIIEYSKSYSNVDYYTTSFNNTYFVYLGLSYKL